MVIRLFIWSVERSLDRLDASVTQNSWHTRLANAYGQDLIARVYDSLDERFFISGYSWKMIVMSKIEVDKKLSIKLTFFHIIFHV